MVEKDDLEEYMKRGTNKLYLTGKTRGISKAEFMSKSTEIPFLHDLMRTETFFRDCH